MTKVVPAYMKEANAAALLDMSATEFRAHVKAGHLPRAIEIAPKVFRWDADALRAINRGDAIDGMDGVQW